MNQKDKNIVNIFNKIEEVQKEIKSLPHFFSVMELNVQQAKNKQAVEVLKARVDKLENPTNLGVK